MKRILALTLLTIALCTCSGVQREALAASQFEESSGNATIGLGIGYMSGNTLYHISNYDSTGGIESELEFPLNTFMLNLEGGYVTRNEKGQDEFRIGLQWAMNLGSGSGKLKDSDWLTDSVDIALVGTAHPGKDIYSESDISLKANILDLRASYNFWLSDRLAIGPMGGYLYQQFKYDASNVQQVGYGPYAAGYSGDVPGLVLTYEVTYTIPYLGIHTELPFSKTFQATVDLGYSPWAAAEDKDDHILRQKVSKAKTTGSAYLASVTAQWEIEDNDFILLRGQYLKIDTTGTQTQTFYDGTGDVFTGIDDKITSKQTTATVLYSHRF